MASAASTVQTVESRGLPVAASVKLNTTGAPEPGSRPILYVIGELVTARCRRWAFLPMGDEFGFYLGADFGVHGFGLLAIAATAALEKV